MDSKLLFTQNDEIEYWIMKLMSNSDGPIGSGLLSEKLKTYDIIVGEAKIGRMLRKMDFKNPSRRIGYQGRVLTDYGRVYLQELENKRYKNKFGIELLNILENNTYEELREILEVRKILEKESARLAALNATEEELIFLKENVNRSISLLESEQEIARHDLSFHDMIADMSRNKVLRSTLNFLIKSKKLHLLLIRIRQEMGARILVDHVKVVNAICGRVPKDAETAMEEHIETVIDDVKNYFKEQQKIV